MSDSTQVVWVTVNGEKFLVEIEDLDQRPIVAIVEGSRFEIDPEDLIQNLMEPEVEDVTNPEVDTHSVPAGSVCEVTSPMPGDITQINVNVGQQVKAGDPLCVLDAMKMKNTIHAPQSGTIAEICVREGDSVEYGTHLFRFN
jgi:biotin carboxyl carrier protein